MGTKKRPHRRTTKEIKRLADRILADAEARAEKDAKEGIKTVIISRKELVKNLAGKTAHSPFINSIGWGPCVRGNNFHLSFEIMNPDPFPWEDDNLGLLVWWSPAGGVMSIGESVAAADQVIGVRPVAIGIMNGSTSTYNLSADHLIPTATRPGRNDLNYALYTVDAFADAVVLKRGTLGVTIG
jgi:hypothetical protein